MKAINIILTAIGIIIFGITIMLAIIIDVIDYLIKTLLKKLRLWEHQN